MIGYDVTDGARVSPTEKAPSYGTAANPGLEMIGSIFRGVTAPVERLVHRSSLHFSLERVNYRIHYGGMPRWAELAFHCLPEDVVEEERTVSPMLAIVLLFQNLHLNTITMKLTIFPLRQLLEALVSMAAEFCIPRDPH